MSDTTDTAPATEAPTTEQEAPATAAFDPKELESRFTQMLDKRVGDFQRMISERETQIADLQRQLKTASMSEEEREQLTAQERDEEVERIRMENELLKLGQQYPDEVKIVQRMLEGQSVSDYVTALRESLAAAKPQQPEPEQEVSDVDKNNPPSTPASSQDTRDMISLPDGRMVTREQGVEMLRQAQTLHG